MDLWKRSQDNSLDLRNDLLVPHPLEILQDEDNSSDEVESLQYGIPLLFRITSTMLGLLKALLLLKQDVTNLCRRSIEVSAIALYTRA